MRRVVGRYMLHAILASGGMATVHFGRLRGPVGFSRTVAIKRLLPQYASDPEFVGMFVDEARLASRIRHPNVVPTVDVVCEDDEIFIVMEYVHGETLSRLLRRCAELAQPIPPAIACRIVRHMLMGLQAAHEAKDAAGAEIGLVHRDVSPQNAIVGVDGVTRLLDFGIAKARGSSQVTREGEVKGKLSYMAPEQLLGQRVTASADIFAAGVVLWETLTGRRLFHAESEGHVVHRIIECDVPLPSSVAPRLGDRFDPIIRRVLARDPAARFPSAREFAQALGDVCEVADVVEVGEWVSRVAETNLAWRAERLAEVERDSLRPSSPAVDVEDTTTVVEQPTPGTGASAHASARSEATFSAEARPRSIVRPTAVMAGVAAVAALAVFVARTGAREDAEAPPQTASALAPTTLVSASPEVTPISSAAVAEAVVRVSPEDAGAQAKKSSPPSLPLPPRTPPPKPKTPVAPAIPDRL